MKIIILSFAWSMISLYLYAQDINGLQKIYRESYQAEADSNYEQAIDVLVAQYDKTSYLMNIRIGWLNYLNGEYFESIEYYEKAITLMPYSLEAKLGIAYPLSMLGNWEEIIEKYQEILTIDAQHSLANYRLGLIYYNRQEYDEALSYVQRVVDLYPSDYYSVVLLGWINLKMGKIREARILFEKALQISPGDSSALEGLDAVVK